MRPPARQHTLPQQFISWMIVRMGAPFHGRSGDQSAPSRKHNRKALSYGAHGCLVISLAPPVGSDLAASCQLLSSRSLFFNRKRFAASATAIASEGAPIAFPAAASGWLLPRRFVDRTPTGSLPPMSGRVTRENH